MAHRSLQLAQSRGRCCGRSGPNINPVHLCFEGLSLVIVSSVPAFDIVPSRSVMTRGFQTQTRSTSYLSKQVTHAPCFWHFLGPSPFFLGPYLALHSQLLISLLSCPRRYRQTSGVLVIFPFRMPTLIGRFLGSGKFNNSPTTESSIDAEAPSGNAAVSSPAATIGRRRSAHVRAKKSLLSLLNHNHLSLIPE